MSPDNCDIGPTGRKIGPIENIFRWMLLIGTTVFVTYGIFHNNVHICGG